jgi:DNA-binding Lrp family transcriptional regulator
LEKLDLKDKKILYHLDLDSRQSFRSIGRKVGLSKDVVVSRVKKLLEKEIIINFMTRYDYSKLGLNSLRFYFKCQYVTPSLKNEIIKHFINHKYSVRVASIEGSYDLIVVMLVKNISDISDFWQKTLDKFGDYFVNRVYSTYLGESIYYKSILVDEKENREKLVNIVKARKLSYDNIDLKILNLIVSNSRLPTLEISKKLNSTTNTINNRIKKLKESGIIKCFTIGINWNKLGYQYFKIDLYLKEYSRIHKIINYIEKNPYLIAIPKTLGYADLEIEMILKNVNHLYQIIEKISNKFPDSIRTFTNFSVLNMTEKQKFPIF